MKIHISFLVTNRTKIIRLFSVIYAALTSLLVVLIVLVIKDQNWLSLAVKLGGKLATISTLLLIISLLPGISRRLNLFLVINKIIMPFRRQVGILMYLTAVSHALLSNYLGRYLAGTLTQFPPTFVTFGFFALILTTPLFLTSNNFSVRLLKRNWGRLHKLVYMVLLLVLIHISLQGETIAILTGVTLLLEIISYVVYFRKKTTVKIPTHS